MSEDAVAAIPEPVPRRKAWSALECVACGRVVFAPKAWGLTAYLCQRCREAGR